MWDAQAHEAQDLRMPNTWATCLVEVTQAGGAAQLGGGKVGEGTGRLHRLALGRLPGRRLGVMWVFFFFFHHGSTNDERGTHVCFFFVVHVASGGKLCAPFMRFKLQAVSM